MRTNRQKKPTEFTHEGAPAKVIHDPLVKLERSVMSCLLFERGFYEDGEEIADRITDLALLCKPQDVATLAIKARHDMNLRHAPLLLLVALCKIGSGSRIVSDTIAVVVRRADELAELLALYWKDGKRPLSAQLKKGLAKAFGKFDAYQLGKYNRPNDIKLRDVMFLTHPKPEDADLYKKLADQTLESPDTWEVALSGGADKKETFTRLIEEGKLGYFALLRNLRNMKESNVEPTIVSKAIRARKGGAERILPFRYVAAARAAPMYEPDLDFALQAAIAEMRPFEGRTIVLVDVSASMDWAMSQRSDITGMIAAATLASIFPAERLRVFTFSHDVVEVPARRGMAGVDAVINSQQHGGTYLGAAIAEMNKLPHDRLVVITDEQSHDRVGDPVCKHAYMINVASNKNGVGYGRWTHIDGFSESIIRYIQAAEG